jgi:hypothetical protein
MSKKMANVAGLFDLAVQCGGHVAEKRASNQACGSYGNSGIRFEDIQGT